MLNIFLELFHLLTNRVWYYHSPLFCRWANGGQRTYPSSWTAELTRATVFPDLKGYESIHDDQVQVKKKSLLTHEPQAVQSNTSDPLSHEAMSFWALTQVARFAFPCLDLGDCRSPEILNEAVLLYRQLGSQMPGALILRGIKDERRWGDNCHAIFEVSGSRLDLICSRLPLSTPRHSTPWHWLNFTLGSLRPNLTALLTFPTPTNSQGAKDLGILSISPLCAVSGTVRWYGLHEHKSELGVGQHGPFLLWQPNHPRHTDAYKWIRTFSLGPLPFSRHEFFSNQAKTSLSSTMAGMDTLWPPVKCYLVSPFSLNQCLLIYSNPSEINTGKQTPKPMSPPLEGYAT